MTKLKSFLPLLLFIVFACEETPTYSDPGPDGSAVKLSRVMYTYESGESSVTEYSYEDGLLKTQTTDGITTNYFYIDRVLSREVAEWDYGYTETKTYHYFEDKISVRSEAADSSGVLNTGVLEYILESESQMRINHYYVGSGNQPLLTGHSICTIDQGNVTSEVSFDSNGSEKSRSASVFGTGLNPYALWEGHPPIMDENLALSTERYLLGEFSSAWFREDIELNADNLPVTLVLKANELDSGGTQVAFFYE